MDLSREAAVAGAVAAASHDKKSLDGQMSTTRFVPAAPTPGWPRLLAALGVASLLAGCTTGDFGEPRPASFMADDASKYLNLDSTGSLPAKFDLTDDERLLRNLAFPFLQPPFDRGEPRPVLENLGVVHPEFAPAYDRSAYAFYLMSPEYTSPSARYARLIDDVRRDITRLPQFFETAARVFDMDAKRQKSIAVIRDISPNERNKALHRIKANREWVELVMAKLGQRISAYRYALERLVVMTPSAQAADTELSINQLKARVAYYRSQPAPTWAREPSLASAR